MNENEYAGQLSCTCLKCDVIYSLQNKPNPKNCPICGTKMLFDEKEDSEL